MRLLPQLTVLLQRGIVVGGQLRRQLGLQHGPFLGGTARNGFGRQGAGLAALPQIPFNGRERDLEQFHDLLAWGAVIHCIEDPLA